MPKENNQEVEQMPSVEDLVKEFEIQQYRSNIRPSDWLHTTLEDRDKAWEKKVEKEIEAERERIFDLIDDFFISPNAILDSYVLRGYLREATTKTDKGITDEDCPEHGSSELAKEVFWERPWTAHWGCKCKKTTHQDK